VQSIGWAGQPIPTAESSLFSLGLGFQAVQRLSLLRSSLHHFNDQTCRSGVEMIDYPNELLSLIEGKSV
jgi:hypothetical protein